ncbi:hypothetical protein C8Q76DRAFT_760252 [Earliella scabrosa]|nr:hypothetical protein C8Q76DRAFT_760252 [Earliella scabrosa]
MRPRVVRRRPAFASLPRSDSDLPRDLTSASAAESDQEERTRDAPPSRPTVVVLGFRQLGFNAMVAYLSTSQRVRYHITVHMNCFNPVSQDGYLYPDGNHQHVRGREAVGRGPLTCAFPWSREGSDLAMAMGRGLEACPLLA